MSNNKNIRCDNCHELVQSDYKFCLVCGHEISQFKNDETMNNKLLSELGFTEEEEPSKFNVSQLICKVLGVSLLILDLIVLIWMGWSGSVGFYVKHNKPIPESILSIDGEFFNLSGADMLYHTFLLVLIIFGVLKIGLWLLNIKWPALLNKRFYSIPKSREN